jgi:hypothetical protein
MTSIRKIVFKRGPLRLRLTRFAVCGLACVAAGAGAAASAAPAVGQWTPLQAPVPGTARTDPAVSVRQLTCADAEDCVGVGSFAKQTTGRNGLIEQLAAGTWTATQAPLPVGAPADAQVVLSSVACPTAAWCGVAGYFDTLTARHPLALVMNGGRWVRRAVPAVAGAGPNSLTTLSSISCAAAGQCVTVGRYTDSAGHYQGLIGRLSGGVWHTSKAPLPADAGSDPVGTLEWVSCVAASKCTAAGAYVNKKGARLLTLDVLSGSTWTAGKAPLPRDADANPLAYLGYVTCLSAGNCTAVGNYSTSLGATHGLILRQLDGTWQAITAPLPGDADPTDPRATLNEVSCPTVTFCAATGGYTTDEGTFGAVIETLARGTWKAVPAPAPVDDQTGHYLASVSCPTALFCVAGGSTDFSGLLDQYFHGRWSATVAPLPNPGFHALFRSNSVSCAAYLECEAFGSYTKNSDTSPQGQGLLESFSH